MWVGIVVEVVYFLYSLQFLYDEAEVYTMNMMHY